MVVPRPHRAHRVRASGGITPTSPSHAAVPSIDPSSRSSTRSSPMDRQRDHRVVATDSPPHSDLAGRADRSVLVAEFELGARAVASSGHARARRGRGARGRGAGLAALLRVVIVLVLVVGAVAIVRTGS